MSLRSFLNSLELSCRNNISRFVYASSVYVSSNSGGLYKVSKKAEEDSKVLDDWEKIKEYGKIYLSFI